MPRILGTLLDPMDRFIQKIEVGHPLGCWYWTDKPSKQGYGRFKFKNSSIMAHRWFYEEIFGKLPVHISLDHLCRNKICVNPDHLEPVTIKENVLRKPYVSRTHCPKGHEFTKENTYIQITPVKNWSRRQCVQCRKIASDKSNNKKKVVKHNVF